MFLEDILKFLTFDIFKLFQSNDRIASEVDFSSICEEIKCNFGNIVNFDNLKLCKKPQRKKEKTCAPQTVKKNSRNSCKTNENDNDSDIDENVDSYKAENDEESCGEISSNCQETYFQSLYSKVLHIITSKASSPTPDFFKYEQLALELWKDTNGIQPDDSKNIQEWNKLRSFQRVPFYWAAFSDGFTCDTPLDNFKKYFIKYIKNEAECFETVELNPMHVWQKMEMRERLPFIMEAIINYIGNNQVNMKDEYDIHKIINQLSKYI